MDDDSDDDDMVSEEFNQILWAHNYEVQWNDINGRKNKVMIFLLFVLALIQSLVLGDINNNNILVWLHWLFYYWYWKVPILNQTLFLVYLWVVTFWSYFMKLIFSMNVTLKNLANQISYVETNKKHLSIFLNEWLNSYCKGQSYGIHNDIQIAGEFKRILGNKFYRWTGLKWWCLYKSILLLHKGQEGWRWTP